MIRSSREAEIYVRYAISCENVIRDKGNIFLRLLSVHSCPRTCALSLKELLKSYLLAKLSENNNESGKNMTIDATKYFDTYSSALASSKTKQCANDCCK